MTFSDAPKVFIINLLCFLCLFYEFSFSVFAEKTQFLLTRVLSFLSVIYQLFPVYSYLTNLIIKLSVRRFNPEFSKMKKILNTLISKYQIQFRSQEMYNYVKKFQQESQKELLNLFIFMTIFMVSVMLIFGIITSAPFALAMNRILMILALIGTYYLGKFNLRLQKILLTGLIGIAVHSMMKNITILSANNLRMSFIVGNGSALFEILLILSMKGVKERSASYLFLTFIKYLGLKDEFFGTSIRTLLLFPISFFGVILYVFNTMQDHRFFKDIYESREKLQKFQELLSNDFPLCVAILNSKLNSIVYSNKFFNDHFFHRSPHEKDNIAVLKGLVLNNTATVPSSPAPKSTQELNVIDFIHESDFANEGQVLTLNAVYEDPNKGKSYYEVKIRKIIWNEEEAYAVVFDDVSDKQMVMALKYADEQKDKVIATVSHELRTPINGILGLIEIISSMITDPLVLKYLENCKSCSKLLLYLVNSILNLGQLRNNKITINKEHILLSKFLEEIRSLYIFHSQQKGIDFIIEKDPQVPEKIYTDQYKLIGILINLLSNAVKFTFRGSVTLKISLDKDDSKKAVFTVIDTGIGIHENDKGQLFTMFGTIKQENKRINTQGVGLGLTIASGLVEALSQDGHGDKEKIEFDSTYGKGTQFWFKVNIYPIDGVDISLENDLNGDEESERFDSREFKELSTVVYKSPEGNMRQYSSPDTKRLKGIQNVGKGFALNTVQQKRRNVLIVDDVPLNLTAVEFILKKLGFASTKAFNGKEAIELLKKEKQRFCLVLTDIQMPIMDGTEMSKEIKGMIVRREIEEIPIVCLTAKGITEKEEKYYRRFGIKYALEKPLVEAQMKNVFEKLGLLL